MHEKEGLVEERTSN